MDAEAHRYLINVIMHYIHKVIQLLTIHQYLVMAASTSSTLTTNECIEDDTLVTFG